MSQAPLWTSETFLSAVAATSDGAVSDVMGISIDSRTIEPGHAFFAIIGDRLDGHDFVRSALERGASCAVIDQGHAEAFAGHNGIVVVDDTLKALERLGLASRARFQGRVIGITGSVGKTGTKEALRRALGASGTAYASSASHNNHWGVPLSLSRCPADSEFGVFEMGMNAAGEIRVLTNMVRPDIAIITTVEPVHIEFFNNGIEGIADAKSEIFEGLTEGGIAVINRDNGQYDRIADAARGLASRLVTFGEHQDADVRLLSAHCQPQMSMVSADVMGTPVTYKIGAPGRHLVLNSLAVMATVSLAGADLARACLALADLAAPKGRGAQMKIGEADMPVTLIDESYNANPASMRAALGLLRDSDLGLGGRRIAVLGDMLELGEHGPAYHRELADEIAGAKVDLVFCAGPLMRHLADALPSETLASYAPRSEDLIQPLATALRPGDVVMVKGSLGSKMGPIVKGVADRFGIVDETA
ncbi:MAG: UDP-N-acetylmuramoylalanyl-D-glutamyl-2,6-diaminopimelate--D-alanyl-D-alanine ligase [Pseudomonadota bacterium]